MKKLAKLILIFTAIAAAVAAIICFRDEIFAFIRSIHARLGVLRTSAYNDICFDDSYEDFDDID